MCPTVCSLRFINLYLEICPLNREQQEMPVLHLSFLLFPHAQQLLPVCGSELHHLLLPRPCNAGLLSCTSGNELAVNWLGCPLWVCSVLLTLAADVEGRAELRGGELSRVPKVHMSNAVSFCSEQM